MYELMSLQIILPPEWFITHITGKLLNHAMLELMSLPGTVTPE
jgi:hypothetical protein